MTYKPYLWLGDDQDAHVRDWREMEDARKRRLAMMIASAQYESGYRLSRTRLETLIEAEASRASSTDLSRSLNNYEHH
jgi:hypothetical protein